MAQANEIILAVMNEVQGLAKKDKNTAQGFNFRGIDAVMNAVGPALRKAGGFIVPRVIERTDAVGQTAKGSPINIVHLTVEYAVHGSEGEPIVGTASSEAFDSGDKATAKAMSVAYRTFLLQLLCLPTDEPDPDTFSYEIGHQEKPSATKTAQPVAWSERVVGLTDVDSARRLYMEAQKAKAPKSILDEITAKVATFGSAD